MNWQFERTLKYCKKDTRIKAILIIANGIMQEKYIMQLKIYEDGNILLVIIVNEIDLKMNHHNTTFNQQVFECLPKITPQNTTTKGKPNTQCNPRFKIYNICCSSLKSSTTNKTTTKHNLHYPITNKLKHNLWKQQSQQQNPTINTKYKIIRK